MNTDENNFDALIEKLKSDDFLIRCDAIEELSHMSGENIIIEILGMLNDRNYLVRCEAYDALIDLGALKELDKIISHLKRERSTFARMHAVAAITIILRGIECPHKTVRDLKKMFRAEKSQRVLIAYDVMLYHFEKDDKYIYDVLKNLDNDDYHIRMNVISMLSDVDEESLVNYILRRFRARSEIETSFAVASLLDEQILFFEEKLSNRIIT